MKAGQLTKRVRKTLHDNDGVRWTDEDLFDYLTASCRELVNLRPDARAVTESIELIANSTRQSIPAGGYKLIDIVRNMGADGKTPGYPVKITTRDDLDDSNAGWHMDDPTDEVDNYTFDDANPTVFYVTPPPDESVFVEIVYSKAPPEIESVDDDIVVDEAFEESLRKYMMYQAFSEDHADPADIQKAASYLSQFYLSLGEEAKAKIAFTPNRQLQPQNGQGA